MSDTQTVPYHFTPDETATFLQFHANDPYVQQYLRTKQPPYGIIVKEQVAPATTGGTTVFGSSVAHGPIINNLLLWIDASNKTHVVLVSAGFAEQVQKAPYVSPDDTGFWDNFKKEFDAALKSVTNIALIVAVALVAAAVLKRR